MHHRRLKPFAQLVLIAVLGSLTACRSAETPRRPNVVVILIDTLRAEYLGLYGYPEETAPFLSELAERSAVFERAFSTSSWTAPSTSSLFTSLYPNQHGVVVGLLMNRRQNRERERKGKETIMLNRLPASVMTLPERFQSMGYATFGMASNPHIGKDMGFSRGFDRFEQDTEEPVSVLFEHLREWKHGIEQSTPFFLYLHFNDVHSPYEAHVPFYERRRDWLEDRRAKYLSQVSYLDEYLRRIYEELNLKDNTILVVTADHGEEFLDHGRLEHPSSLYIELNRVLMMFHAPTLGVSPGRIDVNVSLIDVMPTLIDLIGGEPIPAVEGVSLVPILRKEKESDVLTKQLRRRTLFAHRLAEDYSNPYWGAIWRSWKLIERPDGNLEAYDHRSDPTERRNLYSRDPSQIPAKLIADLEAFKMWQPVEAPSPVEVEVDDELRETLKSLGYVQ
jgi:arylsulfatase A-like enzyme